MSGKKYSSYAIRNKRGKQDSAPLQRTSTHSLPMPTTLSRQSDLDNPHAAHYIAQLREENLDVLRDAIESLEKLGSHAVPALIEALRDNNVVVRKRSAQLLGFICNASAAIALIAALRDADRPTRRSAADALIKIDTQAVPALIEVLQRAHVPYVRWDEGVRHVWSNGMYDRVRSRAARVLMEIGGSYNLPRKILADSRFTPQERINLLEVLRHVRYNGTHIKLRYVFPETSALCRLARIEQNVQAREGAQAVLNWLDGDMDRRLLLRASGPNDIGKGQELVRPVQSISNETEPEELLRPVREPGDE